MSPVFMDLLSKEGWKFLTGAVVTLLGFALSRLGVLINRRRLLRFFGVSTRCPGIAIYLSNMNVRKTEGLPGEVVSVGYQGPAVLNPELVGAIKARDLLKWNRVAILSRKMRELIGRKFITIAPVDPVIQVSPAIHELDRLPASNFICLGSQVYNSVFWRHNHPDNQKGSRCFEFLKNDKNMRGIRIKHGTGRVHPPITRESGQQAGVYDQEIGIVERVNDPNNHASHFFCVGLGASATQGCVEYLLKNWERLYAEHGTDEFGFYLVFPNQASNAEVTVAPEVPMYVKRGSPPAWWRRWL